MSTTTTRLRRSPAALRSTVADHHDRCLLVFAVIVVLHWTEHLVQALQIYALGWPTPDARGVLGMPFPWLVTSEVMHYGYALVMLIGLWLLRGGFRGEPRRWWDLALGLQAWHHLEHLLLLLQAWTGTHLGGGPAPLSIVQFFVPRVELHLFYNTVVTIPMVVAMVLLSRERRADRPVRPTRPVRVRRVRRGTVVRLGLVAVGALCLVVLSSIPAEAHTSVDVVTPVDGERYAEGDPPREVRVAFDEPVSADEIWVSVSSGSTTVTGEQEDPGSRLVYDSTFAIDPLPEGSYRVTVTIVGLDGHTVVAESWFAVGDAPLTRAGNPASASGTPTVRAGAAAAGVLGTVGLVLVGSSFAVLACRRSGLRSRPMARLHAAGLSLAGIATVVDAVSYGAGTTGGGLLAGLHPEQLGATLDSAYGRALLLRSVAIVVLALTLRVLHRSRDAVGTPREAVRVNLLVIAGLVLVLASVTTSHAAASPAGMAALGVAVAHTAAVAVWVGGLLAVAVAWRAGGNLLRTVSDMARFSRIATGSAVTAAVSGVVLALLLTDGLDTAALGGAYGAVLCVKVVVVAALVAAALHTSRRARALRDTDGLRRSDEPGAAATPRSSTGTASLTVPAPTTTLLGPDAAFRRSFRVELLLSAVTVALGVLLATLTP